MLIWYSVLDRLAKKIKQTKNVRKPVETPLPLEYLRHCSVSFLPVSLLSRARHRSDSKSAAFWVFLPSSCLSCIPHFRELFLCYFFCYFFSLVFCSLRTLPSWITGVHYPRAFFFSFLASSTFRFTFEGVGVSSACLLTLFLRSGVRKERNSLCSTATLSDKPCFQISLPLCLPHTLLSWDLGSLCSCLQEPNLCSQRHRGVRSRLWHGRHLRANQSSSIVRFLPEVLVSVCVCVCPLSVRLCSRLPPVFWQPFPLSTVLPLSPMDQPLSHERLPCLPTFSLLFVALKLSLREAVGSAMSS